MMKSADFDKNKKSNRYQPNRNIKTMTKMIQKVPDLFQANIEFNFTALVTILPFTAF